MKFFNKKIIKYIVALVSIFSLVLIYIIIKREPRIAVIGTNPLSESQEVLETSQIDITFNEDINIQSKNGVSVTISPQVEFDSTWLVNTYKVVPKKPLENDTKYEVKILYKNKVIHNFLFETSVFSQADILKYGPLQSEDDFVYGQALKDIVNKYPWYLNLPIKTSSYVIYYDFEKMKFAITCLVPIQDSDHENSLISNALDNLKKIGVKEPILYYSIKPQRP